MPEIINACLGILYDPGINAVFMNSRPDGKVLAGYWEFPGGKIEAGETSFLALIRELKEEIGIEVRLSSLSSLGFIEHQYPHGLAKLEVILVSEWSGELTPLEGQETIWYKLNQKSEIGPLLPTTIKILELLNNKESMKNETIS